MDLEYYYGQEAEQFTFYRLPKALITDPRFKEIANNSKLLYGLMLDRMLLSERSGWFVDENRVFIKYAVKSIIEDLNCSKMTAVGLLKELQGIGLIDVEQKNGLARVCLKTKYCIKLKFLLQLKKNLEIIIMTQKRYEISDEQ